jgi:hypothetical protein
LLRKQEGITHRIIFGMDSKKRYPDREQGVCGRRILVIARLCRITPCWALNFTIELVKVFHLPYFRDVDLGVLRDLIDMAWRAC